MGALTIHERETPRSRRVAERRQSARVRSWLQQNRHDELRDFLRPVPARIQKVSLARRRLMHTRRLRVLITGYDKIRVEIGIFDGLGQKSHRGDNLTKDARVSADLRAVATISTQWRRFLLSQWRQVKGRSVGSQPDLDSHRGFGP